MKSSIRHFDNSLDTFTEWRSEIADFNTERRRGRPVMVQPKLTNKKKVSKQIDQGSNIW